MRSHILLTFCLFYFCKPACSQELNITPDLRFENFKAETNFRSEYFGNLTVDSKGYVWAASNGLYRFDGVRFQYYSNFDNQYHGLRNNYSDDLLTDRFGRLWIGNGSGLCYFNDTLGKFQYINKDPITPIIFAYAFFVKGDDMWFVSNLGLSRINLATLAVTTTSLNQFTDPIETFPLNDDLLGISTRTGVYLYEIKKDRWSKKIFTYQGTTIRIRSCISNQGSFWLGTNKGLWKLDGTGQQIQPVEGTMHLNISDMGLHPMDKEKKYIWIAATNNGLQLYNTQSQRIQHTFFHDGADPHSLPTNNISSLYFDDKDRLWLGTEKGISMFDYRNQSWKIRELNFTEGITTDNLVIRTIQDEGDKEKVWMSCINQGILLVDWKNKQILKHYNDFPPDLSLSFYDMFQLPGKKWILLGKSKLIQWDPASGNTIREIQFPTSAALPVNLELTSIIPVAPDDLYITTNSGLFLFHPSTNRVQPVLKREGSDRFSSNDFIQGVYDKNGVIWLASRKGLVKYDIRQQQVRTFYCSAADSLSANYLNHVAIAGSGSIICAGGSGINVFDTSTETFSRITEFGNTRSPACYGVFIQDTLAWVNSTAGLLRFDLRNKKGELIQTPDNSDVFSPVRFCKVNDELVIGYRNKFVYFNPAEIDRTELPGTPVIERILLNNTPYYNIPHDEIEYSFKHTQNSFSFSFTAFEFTSPGQIRFRYKLEGHDDDWTYLDQQRNASYIRLPPGHYTFRLQAGNKQGQWNESSAVFHMRIIPPFWQRWWFWPLLALSFVTAVITIAMRRIRTIRKREEEKTAINTSMAELEMKLLRSQMNPHFIFNSLNSVQKYIWENKEEDAAEYLANFSKLIRAILENSGKDLISLKEEMTFIKLYIELEHRRSNGHFDYTIRIAGDIDPDRISIPPMLLQPFIENAIWHGLSKKESKGELAIFVSREHDQLICVVDDTGVGRNEKPVSSMGKRSLGIEITRQRIGQLMQHSGKQPSVVITDKKENGIPTGTKVTITLPLQTT